LAELRLGGSNRDAGSAYLSVHISEMMQRCLAGSTLYRGGRLGHHMVRHWYCDMAHDPGSGFDSHALEGASRWTSGGLVER
jgi:hypothetical protein